MHCRSLCETFKLLMTQGNSTDVIIELSNYAINSAWLLMVLIKLGLMTYLHYIAYKMLIAMSLFYRNCIC